jgi:hypothetical protein
MYSRLSSLLTDSGSQTLNQIDDFRLRHASGVRTEERHASGVRHEKKAAQLRAAFFC